MPGLESSVESVVPATLMPSMTTFPLLELRVRSALLGDAIVEPMNERSPIETLATSESTYAFIDCCVASAVAELDKSVSSSSMVVTPAPEPILNVSLIKTIPVPDVCRVMSALDGADNVEPTALRSPRLLPPPPVLTAIPPAVAPSPSTRLPVSTSTARYPSSRMCDDNV